MLSELNTLSRSVALFCSVEAKTALGLLLIPLFGFGTERKKGRHARESCLQFRLCLPAFVMFLRQWKHVFPSRSAPHSQIASATAREKEASSATTRCRGAFNSFTRKPIYLLPRAVRAAVYSLEWEWLRRPRITRCEQCRAYIRNCPPSIVRFEFVIWKINNLIDSPLGDFE